MLVQYLRHWSGVFIVYEKIFLLNTILLISNIVFIFLNAFQEIAWSQQSPPSFSTMWGGTGTGNGQFETPTSIAVDTAGNVFTLEQQNNRVQKFDGNGNFVLSWGSEGTGSGQFTLPLDITVDLNGNVYVVDSNIARIQKFDNNGNFLRMWGYGVQDGSSEFQICTNNCQAGRRGTADGQFFMPRGIAVDPFGNLYITDHNSLTSINTIYRVQKFNQNGNFVSNWVFPEGNGNGQFDGIHDIAIDSSGFVYVGDRNNHRIQKLDQNGNFILTWGTHGNRNGAFIFPSGIAIDDSDNIYVADIGNSRFQKFDSNGGFLLQWGTRGTDQGQFDDPWDVAVDSFGNIYTIEGGANDRVQKFGVTSECTYSVSPINSPTFPPSGGSGDFTINTQVGCSWSVEDTASWIGILSQSSGSGPATVNYSVTPGSDPDAKSGQIRVRDANDQERATFTVNQAGRSENCTYSVTPISSPTFPSSGGFGSFTINTQVGCSWSVEDTASWIGILSASSGTGPTTVNYQASAHSDTDSRTGQIRVRDSGDQVRATFMVNQSGSAPAPNKSPTANAGPDKTVTDVDNNDIESITLDGSNSFDSDGTIVSYKWSWKDSVGFNTVIQSTSTTIATFTVGTHNVTLTVTDDDGATDDDMVTITVNTPQPNNPPTPVQILSPNNGLSFSQGNEISFQGSASDPEDGVLTGNSLVWTSSIDGQIGTGQSFTKNNLSVGTHTITLHATDSQGNSTSNSINIQVNTSSLSEILLGNLVITADSIVNQQANVWRASGNVMINGIISLTADVQVDLNGLKISTLSPAALILKDMPFGLGDLVLLQSEIFSFDGQGFLSTALANLCVDFIGVSGLSVECSVVSINPEGLELTGMLELPEDSGKIDVTVTLNVNSGIQVTIIGNISSKTIKLGNTGWFLRNLELEFDSAAGNFKGKGELQIPGVDLIIKGRLGILAGELDEFTIGLENLNQLLWAAPPIFLQEFEGGLGGLANPPLKLIGGLGFTAGPQVDIFESRFFAVRADIDFVIDLSGRLKGTGLVRVVTEDGRIAQASVEIGRGIGIKIEGELTILEIMIVEGAIHVDLNENVFGFLKGTLATPSEWPLIGDLNLAGFGVYLRNFTIVGNINLTLLNVALAYSPDDLSCLFRIDDFHIGCNFEEIKGSVGVPLTQQYSGFETEQIQNNFLIPSGIPAAIFRLNWEQGNTDFYLIDPNGNIIDKNTAVSTSSSMLYRKNLAVPEAFFIIKSPIPGQWKTVVSNTQSIGNFETKVFGANQGPQIQVTQPTSNTSSSSVNIQWQANDPDDDATISLYYDNNRSGANGFLIADNISEDNGINSYLWNTNGVPSGEYFVYAQITDDKNVPVTSYSLGKVKVGNLSDPLPPLNIQAQPQNGNIMVQWSPNPANLDVTGYKIHYTSVNQIGTFDQQISVGNVSSFTLTNLEAGKTYRVALSTFDENGRSSALSETKIVALPSAGGNLPPKINSTPSKEATEGTLYQYQVQATDPDGGGLIYSFVQFPNGASISSGGLITWTPGIGDVGEQGFKVLVNDGFGGSDTQEFAVQVSALPIQSVPSPQTTSLSVALFGQGAGTVTSTPSGIDCGSDCSEEYPNNTVVRLNATPNANSTFGGWGGDSDCNDSQIIMSGPKTCTATFNLASSTATALTLTANPRSLAIGNATTVTATVLSNGNPVDDGTLVAFTTTFGTFGSGKSVTAFTSGGTGTASVTLTSDKARAALVEALVGTGTPRDTIVVFFNRPGVTAVDIAKRKISGKIKMIFENLGTPGIRKLVIDSAFGSHTVTTARFDKNPAGSPTFNASGHFFDVHLDIAVGINSLTVEFCPADANTIVYFWDGSSWAPVSNQTFTNGCVEVTITAATFPSLTDLTGQFFGLGTPLGTTGGDPPIWGNIMAFPTPESALGQDLDGDGDMFDTVLRYKHLDSGEVINTGLQVSNRHRDMDMYEDTIVFVEQTQYPAGMISTYNVKTGQVKQTGVLGVRPTIHGQRIAISGSTVRYYDLQRNKLIDTSIPGTGPAIWGEIIAFQRQIHKDFSPTIRYYNIDTGEVVNTKVAGYEPVLYERRIAFTTAENLIAQDLNGDGDFNDKVIRFYDIDTGKVTNTGQVGRYPSIYGQRIVYSANKEIHYYDMEAQAAYNTHQLGTEPDIYEDTISYYLWEEWLIEDLNGDADRKDPIVLTYKIPDASVAHQVEEKPDLPLSVEPLSISRLLEYPNPISLGSTARFMVEGIGIKEMNVVVYDLSGRLVYESGFIPNKALTWNLLNNEGHRVANGVYLYVMTVRGFDENVIRSEVKKLVVLR